MIYRNFLYFIVAVAILVSAPASSNDLFPLFQDILIIPVLIFLFSLHVRNSFHRLTRKDPEQDGAPVILRADYERITNFSLIKALFVFALEIYLFDLKAVIMSLFRTGGVTFAADVVVLSVFILHFAIVWYRGYKTAGESLHLSESVSKFIFDNIKFNLAIVIPWLILTLGTDLLRILNIRWIAENSDSVFFQLVFFSLFLVIFLVLGPLLIVRLWDCKPLPEGDLRDRINIFLNKEGISFRQILSWNSLSSSLITAGVLGYFPFFRYLLLTPELIRMLSAEEIIAVVCHETGHVKRKHVLYYLLFFIGFGVLSGGVMGIISLLILNSPFGVSLLTGGAGIAGLNPYHILIGLSSILLFILYFRFLFGYFMRNFEREADIYCFDAAIDPDLLISSFEKLGAGIREKKGSNWHHYSIRERIEFLERCKADREVVSAHRKKVKKNNLGYVVILAVFAALLTNPVVGTFSKGMENRAILRALETRIIEAPDDPRLYAAAGAVYHEMKDWKKAKVYYEQSLEIRYEQPETLNNLAWLLVTCEDESIRERRRGLRLARDAAALSTEAHIYDTLAEALLLNEKYGEALRASENALAIAENNISYYKSQVEKMRKFMRISGATFRL